MGVASARGKLLLFGEHSAVYGHPAVGLSLPWALTVVHTPGPLWELPGLGRHEQAVRDLVGWFEDGARAEGLPPLPPGRLEFTSAIPVASGFGSSGALCACLTNLFFPAMPLGDKDRWAWLAEGRFHGTPSGIDTALALRSGWWVLDPSTRPVTASALADPGLVLVVGAVVRDSNTKALVGGLAARRHAGEPLVVETIQALGEVSREAGRVLAQGDHGLGALVARARTGVRALGLETPTLTAALDAGLGCPGALGGKLSGAGGGGAFFLLFDTVEAARAALPRIEASIPAALWAAKPQLLEEKQL